MPTDPSFDWERLRRSARGRPVVEVESDYRRLIVRHDLRGVDEYAIQATARAMADPRWAQHHPLGAVAFAWRHRRRRGFVRALRTVYRPRFAG